MFPLVPLNLAFGAGPAIGGTAGGPVAWNQGAWTVNVAGSGPSAQVASGGLSLGVLLLAAGAAFFLLRRG